MDDVTERAQDARLEWALTEVAGRNGPPDVLATVRDRIAGGGRTPARLAGAPMGAGGGGGGGRATRPWFAAACAVLGLGAAVAVWCERRHDGGAGPGAGASGAAVPLQQPAARQPVVLQELAHEPAPPALAAQDPTPQWVAVPDPAELAKLPEDTAAVRCWPRQADDVRALARLRSLTHLDLGLAAAPANAPLLDGDVLRAVGALPSLRVLHLDQRVEIDPTWLQALEGLPLLETLSLRHVPVGDADALRLARLPSLQRLDLAFDQALGDEGLAALVAMPRLRELSLRACGGVTRAGLAALGRAKSLEAIDLVCTAVARPEGAERATDLRRVETMLLLEMSLAATADRGVDDGVLRELGALERLRVVRLGGCPAVTGAGIAALAKQPLQELELSLSGGCGEVVAALPPTLHTLRLPQCRALTDADLAVLAKRVAQLRTLDLQRCGTITAAGLQHVLDACTLRVLDLTLCRGIGPEALPALSKHESLEQLDTTGLAWVDADAEQRLRAMPNLRQLTNRRVGGVMMPR